MKPHRSGGTRRRAPRPASPGRRGRAGGRSGSTPPCRRPQSRSRSAPAWIERTNPLAARRTEEARLGTYRVTAAAHGSRNRVDTATTIPQLRRRPTRRGRTRGAAPTSARPTLYLAPAGDCGGTRLQEMLGLHDYARHQAGLPALRVSAALMRAAWAKSADIARCGFSPHGVRPRVELPRRLGRLPLEPLGREHRLRQRQPLPSARTIFAAWLRSDDHRANILDPAFRDIGVGSHRGTFEGWSARFWVVELGRH